MEVLDQNDMTVGSRKRWFLETLVPFLNTLPSLFVNMSFSTVLAACFFKRTGEKDCAVVAILGSVGYHIFW
jgi:hypothetical protein